MITSPSRLDDWLHTMDKAKSFLRSGGKLSTDDADADGDTYSFSDNKINRWKVAVNYYHYEQSKRLAF